jgi:hypothetical protein
MSFLHTRFLRLLCSPMSCFWPSTHYSKPVNQLSPGMAHILRAMVKRLLWHRPYTFLPSITFELYSTYVVFINLCPSILPQYAGNISVCGNWRKGNACLYKHYYQSRSSKVLPHSILFIRVSTSPPSLPTKTLAVYRRPPLGKLGLLTLPPPCTGAP